MKWWLLECVIALQDSMQHPQSPSHSPQTKTLSPTLAASPMSKLPERVLSLYKQRVFKSVEPPLHLFNVRRRHNRGIYQALCVKSISPSFGVTYNIFEYHGTACGGIPKNFS